MNDIIMDFNIRDEYQNSILQFTSDEMRVVFRENINNRIVLKIPKLLLRGGNYSIRLFATNKVTTPENHCDNIENAAFLTVLSFDIWNYGKAIRNGKIAIIKGYYSS